MIRKIYVITREFTSQINRDNVSAYAASTAFFIFLSLIPILVLICSIIPYTSLTEVDLETALIEITPAAMDMFVVSLVKDLYARTPTLISVSAVFTVWSAGKGVLALIRGLNAVNGVVDNSNYFLLRVRASVYTLIMLIATILSLVIMVFGNILVGLLLKDFPRTQLIFQAVVHFRFLFVWLILTVIFALLYTWIPNKKLKLKMQIPGALFAAVAWSAFSWGFSIYVEHFNGFSMYGSLTTIIIIMLWLYFCMYIIMIGANLNRFFSPAFKFFIHTS